MKVVPTALPGVLLLEPQVYGDERGFFFESYNARRFAQLTGLSPVFVQDNHSKSAQGVLRGLHYQLRQTQAKLVRAVAGEVFDVVVDVRRSSPTFGQHVTATLSAENKRQMWVPEGFAHGFLVLSAVAEVEYKTTDCYAPEFERSVRWNDPALAIQWPLQAAPVLSAKDAAARLLAEAEVFP